MSFMDWFWLTVMLIIWLGAFIYCHRTLVKEIKRLNGEE